MSVNVITRVVYDDAEFEVHGTLTEHKGEKEFELSGAYLKGSTVDLGEMLDSNVIDELGFLVLDEYED